MKSKKTPYLFLMFLTVLLFFILGFRYGQKVENTNKINQLLASIPPSPTLQPTPPFLTFKTYKNSSCGISFLYPSSLTLEKESTSGALFFEKKEVKLSLDCAKKDKTDTSNVLISSKLSFQKQIVVVSDEGNRYIFDLKNPINSIVTTFSLDKNLYPLLEKSLEFSFK